MQTSLDFVLLLMERQWEIAAARGAMWWELHVRTIS